MTTIGQWLAHDNDVPRLEKEYLLADQLCIDRSVILAYPERQLTHSELDILEPSIGALRNGVPYAYVVGKQEFWGLSLKVHPGVLIPRPETELLVEQALLHTPKQGRLLDLGTGSGAIAIALGSQRTDIELSATDVVHTAISTAACNAKAHAVEIEFYLSDWFEALPPKRWHTIASNPPYIADHDAHLANLQHEPNLALTAGDGYAALRKIIQQAPLYLTHDGTILLEHGYDQAEEVRRLLLARGFVQVRSHLDLARIPRVTEGHWTDQ